MHLVFDSEDDVGFEASRDVLLARFEGWAVAGGLVPSGDEAANLTADAALALDWKRNYGDGHLVRWTTQEVLEFLLEWCPRKLSAAPAECRSVPDGLVLLVRFLDAEGILAGGSSPPPAIARAVAKVTGEFVAAMGDPSKFGLAKSLFASALGDGVDFRDPEGLNEWIAEFNARPREERREVVADRMLGARPRLPTLPPVVLPDDDAVAASRAEAPILAKFAALAEFVGTKGRRLTQTGKLTLGDARLLVDRLATGDRLDPAIGTKTWKTRSSADLPGLQLVFKWARKAGIVRVAHGRVFATKQGLGLDRDRAAHFERGVDALFEMGVLSGQRDPQRPLAWPEVNAMIDSMAVHVLAGPYAAARPIPIQDIAELVAAAVLDSFTFPYIDDDRVTRIVGHDVEDIVDVLVLAGMAHIAPTSGPRLDGTVELTAAGRVSARRLLIEAGYGEAPGPRLSSATAAELLASVDISADPENVAAFWAEVEAWAHSHEPAEAARQLADAATTLDGPLRNLALVILDTMDLDVAAPEVRRIAGQPPTRGLARCWLVDHGLEDEARLFDPADVSGFIDALGHRMILGGPEALRATLSLVGVRQRQIDLIAEVGRSPSGLAEGVLLCLAETHRDKFVARAAQRAILQRRGDERGRGAPGALRLLTGV